MKKPEANIYNIVMSIFLSAAEKERYKRQIMLFGEKGQKRLKKSTVFMVGAGGLGSSAALYLAGAGIGRIIIADSDKVELSNLNRQVLHSKKRIQKNKALSAKTTLEALNDNIKIEAVTERITGENIDQYARQADLLLDCLDNFETRFLLNSYAVEKKKPLLFGGISGYFGQLALILPKKSFCLACIFEGLPAKGIFPVLGATPGVIGSLQAMEAVKYLAGTGGNLKSELLTWNGLTQEFRKIVIKRDPHCVVCGKEKR